jgi:hypothetical protein
MSKLPYRAGLFLLALAALILPIQASVASGPPGSETVMDRINNAVEPFDNMKIESAHQLPVKTVQAIEQYQGGSFKVLARKDAISRFRCSVCHKDKQVRVQDGALFTHADIKLNHGKGENELACIECHDEKNRDFLIDKQGRQIDYDHSYQLCGQCHFRQKRDWLGGAHGKREAYWAGERVVRNCTSCHNPHSPAFETKMPATYSLPLD